MQWRERTVIIIIIIRRRRRRRRKKKRNKNNKSRASERNDFDCLSTSERPKSYIEKIAHFKS